MKYSRSLVATLLMSGGLLQLTPLALAVPTAAGTPIENTATATYEDPSGAVSNTTSNTVTVTVSEIAGITITAGSVFNTGATLPVNTGAQTGVVTTAPTGNDNLIFEFDLTNTGNDATDFRVPNQAQVGNSPITVSKVQYFDKAANSGVGEWKDVNAVNNIITKNSTNGGDIDPGTIVRIRVLATVNAGTTTGNISLTLGNTGATNQQNIALDANTAGDVFTVDKANNYGINETSGIPSNGVREAAASSTPTVISPPVPTGKQALVKVTKVAGPVDDKTTTTDITDDEVTYTLGVEVGDTAPAGSGILTADLTDLAGTKINLDGNTETRILVADAIPTGAVLTAKPVAPSGWTVVYTDATIGTTAANDSSVQWQTWGTTAPTLNTVTRIGFIKTGTVLKGAANAVTGFTMTVKLNLPASGGSRRNIAQAFGSTLVNGNPDFTKPSVDESGDAEYNNLNSDGTVGLAPTNGIATTADGTDPGNNTGVGPGGEATVVTLSSVSVILPGNTVGILNGTNGQPGAEGTVGNNNDDFTNKSVTVDTTRARWTGPNGTPALVNAQSIGFTNTVSLVAGAVRDQYVSLLPTAPLNKADLPNGSVVKILYGGVTVIYTYDNTGTTGVFTPTLVNGFSPAPIRLTVPKTGNVNYGVEIDLPATEQFKGYPVSITAFANGAPAVAANTTANTAAIAAVVGNDVIDATDDRNITIDRIYTGYLKLEKEAQVYKINNGVTTVISPFAPTAAKAEPGEYIEYRIKYRNISEPVLAGSNSIGLSANNIKILENGAPNLLTGTNNSWAASTEHKPGSTFNPVGTTVKFEGGVKADSDTIINEYLNEIPTLLPDSIGEFRFTRQVKK